MPRNYNAYVQTPSSISIVPFVLGDLIGSMLTALSEPFLVQPSNAGIVLTTLLLGGSTVVGFLIYLESRSKSTMESIVLGAKIKSYRRRHHVSTQYLEFRGYARPETGEVPAIRIYERQRELISRVIGKCLAGAIGNSIYLTHDLFSLTSVWGALILLSLAAGVTMFIRMKRRERTRRYWFYTRDLLNQPGLCKAVLRHNK